MSVLKTTKQIARHKPQQKIHLQRRRIFVILSVAKNPRFKGANSHFDFMDTSPKAQYDKADFIFICVCKLLVNPRKSGDKAHLGVPL